MWGIKLIFLVFACNLIIFPFDVSCTHSVPVYLWETSQFPEIVPALTPLEKDEFKKIISDRSTADPVLVFTEETLSPEDFALRDSDGKSIFALISTLKSSAHTTYWPLVNSPITAVSELPKKNIVKTSIKELQDNPKPSVQNNDIIIVDLNDVKEDEDRLEMLKRHDKAIMDVYQRFAKTNDNIISMLTSYRSSWVITEEIRSSRRARSVNESKVAKADESEKPSAEPKPEDSNKIYANPQLLIYVNSTAKLNFKGTSVTLTDYALEKSAVSDDSVNVTMASSTETEVSLMFHFKYGGGYWSLNNITIDNTTGTSYFLWVKDVYAPIGNSYHCHGQTFFNLSHSDVNLTLPGFQMQLYINTTEENKKFGPAYDCVGFTTAPIWSGLFVTFIMVLIMTFGLSMMMDIKTMDRFDDPKGKTITINASE